MSEKTTGVMVRTRTTRAIADRLAQLARANGRSVASELRIAIERHLERVPK